MQLADVTITHPDKIMYPGTKVTKLVIAQYYHDIAEHMLPHIAGRPVSLVRSPEGIGKGTFYQRHPQEYFPDYIERIRVQGREEQEIYITLDAANDLVFLANNGVIEFHTWGASLPDLDHPDQLTWDLDPATDAEWPLVVTAAKELKSRLDKLNLQSFPKLSGSKGIHIMLPIATKYTWDEAKDFVLKLARELEAEFPDKFTTKVPKKERIGKVFIDYIRNSKGASSVAPFSLRTKQEPSIAVPISWAEVTEENRPNKYTIGNIHKRLSALKADPWAESFHLKQKLP